MLKVLGKIYVGNLHCISVEGDIGNIGVTLSVVE